ncbi:hypothetical protein RDABS01_040178 [Bienertia sinuspersici]
MSSRWSDPPSDILPLIADHLHRQSAIPRLRSVCNSWRSSLSSLPSSSITFPLNLPSPLSNSPSSPTRHFSLHQRTVFLLSPLSDDGGCFIIKVEESGNPNTFSLFNPLFARAKLPPSSSPVNLLDYRLTHVCDSYVVHSDSEDPIKKVVVGRDFLAKGDFVVLGLKYSGGLLFWKLGDENWTEIMAFGRSFDDIICYNGKFYATADGNGRLVMIDSRLKPIDLVPKLTYGNGVCTSLVECNGNLYLADRQVDVRGVRFGVFKLDDKGHFWDYEPNLNGYVFFLGDDVNFSVFTKDYNGGISDVIYFKDIFLHANDTSGFSQVFDMKTGTSWLVIDTENMGKFYWPPSSWFVGAETDSFH